jgi:serine-type D-Ala-D-Ala carboxypeptidase
VNGGAGNGKPEDVREPPTPLRRLLDEGVGRAYPGAVLAVSYRGDTVIRWAVGARALIPSQRPAAPDTIYDLASLTKVVATLPLILQGVAEGRIALDAPLATYLSTPSMPTITIRQLLIHASGLPAWIPFYLQAREYHAVLARVAATAPAFTPGSQVVYSDLGFILLGDVACRALGGALDTLARQRIFAPLGMHDTTYLPDHAQLERIAPTEDGTAIEQTMAGEAGRRHTWRRYLIWGEVHDSNAHAMGGVSGHAGLFGTADDLMAYARMWLAGGRGQNGAVLPPDLVREATTIQAPGAARGLGWALTGAHGWWNDALSPRAFGHTGFTGTALAIDPGHDLAIAFLTNAVHLGRDRTELLALRPQIAAAVAAALRIR